MAHLPDAGRSGTSWKSPRPLDRLQAKSLGGGFTWSRRRPGRRRSASAGGGRSIPGPMKSATSRCWRSIRPAATSSGSTGSSTSATPPPHDGVGPPLHRRTRGTLHGARCANRRRALARESGWADRHGADHLHGRRQATRVSHRRPHAGDVRLARVTALDKRSSQQARSRNRFEPARLAAICAPLFMTTWRRAASNGSIDVT
jgi:hypothetical protein